MNVTVALRVFPAPLAPRDASTEARRLLAELLHAKGIPDTLPLTLRKADNGRPYLPDTSVDFNLSHAGRYVVCAIAAPDASEPPIRIGVDLEIPHRAVSPERLARRFFAPAEQELLRRDGFSLSTFLRIWTQKEAFLKLTGEGLSGGLARTDTTDPTHLTPPVHFTAYPVPGDPTACLTLCLPLDCPAPTALRVL